MEGVLLPIENLALEWYFVLFLFMIGALGYLRIQYGGLIISQASSYLLSKQQADFFDIKDISPGYFIVNVLAVVNISFFFSILNQRYQWMEQQYPIILLFLAFVIIVALYWLTRWFADQFLAWLFEDKTSFQFQSWLLGTSLRLTGLVLIPCNIMSVYTPMADNTTFFSIAWLSIIIISAWRVVRSVLWIKTQHVSISYIILYLCALEIAPVLIALKLTGVL